MSWATALKRPIHLGDGRALKTLSDVRAYILELPESEQSAEAWHTAAEILLYAAEQEGPWLDFVRIASLQALNRNDAPPAPRSKAARSSKRRTG